MGPEGSRSLGWVVVRGVVEGRSPPSEVHRSPKPFEVERAPGTEFVLWAPSEDEEQRM